MFHHDQRIRDLASTCGLQAVFYPWWHRMTGRTADADGLCREASARALRRAGQLTSDDATGGTIGALHAGVVADTVGVAAAIWVVAAITASSGLIVMVRMSETLKR